MKKTSLILLIFFFHFLSYGEMALNEEDILDFQIELSRQVTENISRIFQDFSDGNIEADVAFTKIMVLENTYLNSIEPVPPEAERLRDLMKKLFSKIEDYFIYFRRTSRENPEINREIVETKYEVAKEAVRLDYLKEESYGAY